MLLRLPASDRLDDFRNVHVKDDEDSGPNPSAAKKCEAVGMIFETVFDEMKREGFEVAYTFFSLSTIIFVADMFY